MDQKWQSICFSLFLIAVNAEDCARKHMTRHRVKTDHLVETLAFTGLKIFTVTVQRSSAARGVSYTSKKEQSFAEGSDKVN